MITFPIGNKLQMFLIGALIIASFLIGSLYTKVQYLEKNSATNISSKQVTGTVPPSENTGENALSFGSADKVDKLRKDDHVRGARNARILLFEYSDLECPFCKRFHPTAKQIVDEYKGQVAWVYRHFPLDQIHSKADKEAEAIECAKDQGGEDAFWRLTDKIFEVTPSNNGLNLDDLPKLAGDIGLNSNNLKTCLDSGKYASHVEEDYQGGIKAGITGTPGNILLDIKTGKTKLTPGALPFDQFKVAIDDLLKS